MASPIYFFPKLPKQALLHEASNRLIGSTLARYGLLEHFGDIKDAAREVAVWESGTKLGPDQNLHGVMLRAYVRQPDGSMLAGQIQGYSLDGRQTWHHVLDVEETQLWIGLENDSPPTPQDLRRRRQFSGYEIELGDGNNWLIPIVRRPDGSSELPCAMKINRGNFQQRIREQYRQAWEDTGKVVDWFETGEYALIERRPEALEMAIRMIGQNYRFGHHEQNVLELIDQTNYLNVLLSAVDWPLVEAIAQQKKTQSADTESTTTATGQVADSPITIPAAAS